MMQSTRLGLKFIQKSPRNCGNIWIRSYLQKSFGDYSIVRPRNVSKMNTVPPNIMTPCYYKTSVPLKAPLYPEIKNESQIQGMVKSCKLARYILDTVGNQIKVGMTTDEIDILVHELAIKNNAYPSPLNYMGFPKSVCTSVNNVACHGIPDDRPLEDGDIVTVDVTVYVGGYHGDCSDTFQVGNVDVEGIHLVKTNRMALETAISICGPGQPFALIGKVIEDIAIEYNYTVIPSFSGHGIGSYFHGPPDIYHFYNNVSGEMAEGMTFTIEPIFGQGSEEVEILDDGWSAITVDDSRTAQCEETILIRKYGCQVLTKKQS